MFYLFSASLLWSLSFGLIKTTLANLHPAAVAAIRLAISLLGFLPFLRLRRINSRLALELIALGAIQYGVMYLAYIQSFQFLHAYEVALFTILTPFYVIAFSALDSHHIGRHHALAALMAIAGAGMLIYTTPQTHSITPGFLLVQLSNMAFAIGQVRYKRIINSSPHKEIESFALLYLGGTLVACAALFWTGPRSHLWPSPQQWLVLLFLGVVASGLAFFCWNLGAVRSSIGVLAVFNNVKVPLAVLAAVVLFHERMAWPRFIGGAILLIGAVLLENRRHE